MIRHEGSHAVAALIEGAKILQIQPFPEYAPNGDRGLVAGYIEFEGTTGWFTSAAPFMFNVIISIASILVGRYVARRFNRFIFLNFLILFPGLSLWNSGVAFFVYLLTAKRHVASLVKDFPAVCVHLSFAGLMIFYVFSIIYVIRSFTAQRSH